MRKVSQFKGEGIRVPVKEVKLANSHKLILLFKCKYLRRREIILPFTW